MGTSQRQTNDCDATHAPTSIRNAMRPLRRLVLLCLAALASRAVTLGNPVLGIDEEFYFAAARAVSNGALPFVDIWDRKPIGLFLLYLPAALLPLPWGVLAYHLLACVSVVGTAWIIAHIAERAGWARGATMAALLYILMLPLAGGEGGQTPVFYDLPMVAAAALTALPQRRRRSAAALAMVLAGIALQVKTSALFEGIWLGLWAMYREWEAKRSAAGTLILGSGLAVAGALPTAIAVGTYAAIGHFDAFLFANVGSILLRGADPLAQQIKRLALLTAVIAVPLAMACLSPRATEARGRDVRRFVHIWCLVAIVAVLVPGTWFRHYALPILVPASIAAAGFLGHAPRRRAGLAVLMLCLVGGQALLLDNRRKFGTAEQFARIVAAVGAVKAGHGCLHVYSGTPMLYPATGRCAVTARVFPSHLIRERENGASGVDQLAELDRIFRSRPAVITMRPLLDTERLEVRLLAEKWLRRDYRLAATRPLGRDLYQIYARRDGTADEGSAIAWFR